MGPPDDLFAEFEDWLESGDWGRWPDNRNSQLSIIQKHLVLKNVNLLSDRRKWDETCDRFEKALDYLRNEEEKENKRSQYVIHFDFHDFTEHQNLSNIKFPCRVHLDFASFSSTVEFKHSEFLSMVFFNGCVFHQKVNFEKTTFHSFALFNEAVFSKKANFENSVFDFVDFTKCQFDDYADFQNAEFGKQVFFVNAYFVGPALFVSAKFKSTSSFVGANVSTALVLDRTEFDDDLWLEDLFFNSAMLLAESVKIDGNLIVRSVFLNIVDFSGLSVTGYANFGGSYFHHIPNFINSTFELPPEVAGMEVLGPKLRKRRWSVSGKAEHANAVKNKGANAGSRPYFGWQKSRTGLMGAAPNIPEITAESNILFKTAENSSDVIKLRKLKAMALQANDHEKDGEFFAKEMLAKRGVETTSFSGLLFNTLYWKLSDFGQDFIRPLKAMFVSFLVFMVVHYSIVYCWVETTTKTTSWNQLGFALEMSIRNVIPVLGGLFGALPRPTNHQSSFMTTYLDLARNGVDADWLVIIGIVQNIIGAVLLFLFLLALRNKFRLK